MAPFTQHLVVFKVCFQPAFQEASHNFQDSRFSTFGQLRYSLLQTFHLRLFAQLPEVNEMLSVCIKYSLISGQFRGCRE